VRCTSVPAALHISIRAQNAGFSGMERKENACYMEVIGIGTADT